MLARKLAKLTRRWSWQLRGAECVPLFWHVGTPNFGDDINPLFFQRLCDVQVRFSNRRDKPHFLGIGSILNAASANSTVLGSGLISPGAKPPNIGRVVAVRGLLSRDALGLAGSTLLGDPMILVDLIEPKVAVRNGKTGLVPHVSNVGETRRKFGDRFVIIDPACDPFEVVSRIASCTRVISQSLHGLIVADAMEVPNVWLAPSANMAGQDFKFMDYFSTIAGSKTRIDEVTSSAAEIPDSAYSVNPYVFDKKTYREALTETLRK